MATLMLREYEEFESNRWRFYYDFFDSTLKRQGARPGQKEIKSAKDRFEALHVSAAFEIQSKGKNVRHMTRKKLDSLLDEHLSHIENAFSLVTEHIALLTDQKQDAFGFYVKPLQEFLAARKVKDCILQKDDDLLHVFSSSDWINVSQFVLDFVASEDSPTSVRVAKFLLCTCDHLGNRVGVDPKMGVYLAAQLMLRLRSLPQTQSSAEIPMLQANLALATLPAIQFGWDSTLSPSELCTDDQALHDLIDFISESDTDVFDRVFDALEIGTLWKNRLAWLVLFLLIGKGGQWKSKLCVLANKNRPDSLNLEWARLFGGVVRTLQIGRAHV